MKRKQKRFLQMTLLFTAALIFLPDIGLWSLYKEKHLVKPAEPAEPQVVTFFTLQINLQFTDLVVRETSYALLMIMESEKLPVC
ncbi:polypeptide N-acetylgalactosaminyltransferase-like 6 [Grus japonensis]|uniref:Polypeptide N-acetylgalactosaminyltransferase-like 6 n=1 Tax=Grus japonensis TaxID=30415 RepID=A0ABC9WTD4_GRUJA